MGLQEAIQNVWSSDYVQKNPNKAYKVSYGTEYAAVAGYLNGGAEPNWSGYSKLGKGLCEVEKERRLAEVPVPPEPEPIPPEPPPATGYFNETFVNISSPEWASVQTYVDSFSPGPSPGVQQDPSGRLSLVAAPDGVGRALRFEIQQSDPQWSTQSPAVHRCQLGAPTQAIWNAPVMTIGDVRWFDMELWIPNEFDWARNSWNALIGIHPSGSTGWGAFNIVVEGGSDWGHSGDANAHIDFKLGGGTPAGTTANLQLYPLIRLTNADGSRHSQNFNRRIHLRYGGRFAPDNTGWAEAWVDGVNVLPRVNRPTCWADDFHQYMKLGPYKEKSRPYPSGKTVIYFTRVSIGY